MKVILISVIPGLGKIGDVLEVKNGYAKNFLIPSKKAICFTVNNYKTFELKKHEFEQENLKNLGVVANLKAKISDKNIVVIQNASDDGRLYGSVNSSIIAARINEIVGAKSVSRLQISLEKPIKEIGVYKLKMFPYSENNFEVKLVVSRSESEVEAILKAEKKKDQKDEAVSPEAASEKPETTKSKKKSTEKPKAE